MLADHTIPKTIHDAKRALHTLATVGIDIAGLHHEPMLYSYLLDPTYSSHSLAEIALRRFNLKLAGGLSESADISGRFAQVLREQVEQAGLLQLYHDIDLPLLSVLARMEHAGVKIDTPALAKMSSRLEKEIDAKAKEIYTACDGFEFNINSPKQLGDALFNKLNLPKPVKYGKGKMISTAVDVLEDLAASHRVPAMFTDRAFADDGGLMAYGPNVPDNFRRVAGYVDKILKGARPAELPVEQPSTYDFVINLETARALGLTIPQSVLQQATEIIQ